MAKIELAPFNDSYDGLGLKTSDSTVGTIQSRGGSGVIVKWNRSVLLNEGETRQTCVYLNKSISLYKLALGAEFVVPTQVVMGAKGDSGIAKYKTYIFQEFVDGWTAKDLPESLRTHPGILNQWNLLNSRLFHLFNSERYVNRQHNEAPFPIGITLGSSRSSAFRNEVDSPLPRTPNLLVDRESLRISVCDFGKYVVWNDAMQPAYESLLKRIKM